MQSIPSAGAARNAVSVTPGDSGTGVANGDLTGLSAFVRGLLIGSGGSLSFTDADGVNVTVTVPSGLFPVHSIKRVRATGTTASQITVLYDPL